MGASIMKKTSFAISAFLLLSGAALAQGVEYKELKKKLKSGNVAVCLDAVQAIGKLNDTQAVRLLEITLEDRNWEVRQSAVIALGKIK
jgi:HEAT repeat protein